MFVVIYVKVTDDKKDGITFTGPTLGPTRDTFTQAEDESRALINQNRHCTVITRIYQMSNILEVGSILHDAREYFSTLRQNMIEAKEAMSRPIHRRRKKKIFKQEEAEGNE
jgi:hypothetical protein